MTHEALYRKYRPTDFKDVVGQGHVTDVLLGSLKQGTISHAYLFYGSRGTGKTTVARILAKRLGVSSEDTLEIDAASNRGIDDIRELRESVHTLPFNSEYKVYIIDEVHMLTKEAFNALLKTLEEPPRHVIFILATTEQDKIPETILSRCQVFTFKDPTSKMLAEHLKELAHKEGYTLGDDSAELIAFMANGSFRDSQSILQKVISYSGDKKLDHGEVSRVVGAPPKKLIQDFLKALVEDNTKRLFEIISEAQVHTLNMEIFLKLLIKHLRQALLLRYAPDMKEEVKAELGGDIDFYLELLKGDTKRITSKTLEIFLQAEARQGKAFIQTLPLELAVIEIVEIDKK